MSEIWGIDLGGTKIEGVILDTNVGPEKPIARLRVETETEKGYEHIYAQIHRVVKGFPALPRSLVVVAQRVWKLAWMNEIAGRQAHARVGRKQLVHRR